MKAVVLYDVEDLRVVERDIPIPRQDEILAKVKRAQVSVSELNKLRGIRPLRTHPIVPGHEFSAEVVRLHDESGDLAVGDRVVANDHVPCGHCYYCRRNMSDVCTDSKGYGSDIDGAFQEYMILRKSTVYKLPEEITFEEGAFVEPLSTCVEAVRKSGVAGEDTAVIMGQGLMGLLLTQLLKRVGTHTIAVDLKKYRVELSERLGVDYAIDASKESAVKRVIERTDGVGADVVFEAAGNAATFRQAFEIARRGATIVQIGHIWSQPPLFPVLDFYYKDLRIVSARGHAYPESMEILKAHDVNTKALITHVFKLDEIAEAYQARSREDAIAVQLQIS